MKNSIIWLIVIIILALGGIYLITQNNKASQEIPGNTNGEEQTSGDKDEETTPPLVSEVKIALLDNERTSGSKIERGCDLVTFTTRQITPTTMPLSAAMKELFAIDKTEVDGYYNFLANTTSTLSFDKAEVVNGVARIYLKGKLSGLAGVCDDPRAQAQIEETALQFPSVKKVEIYLNGEPTVLTPSQK